MDNLKGAEMSKVEERKCCVLYNENTDEFFCAIFNNEETHVEVTSHYYEAWRCFPDYETISLQLAELRSIAMFGYNNDDRCPEETFNFINGLRPYVLIPDISKEAGFVLVSLVL